MVSTDDLRGLIAKNRLSQKEVAEKLGITPKTFYIKMKKGTFNSDEMYNLMKLLKISNPIEIFFADEVAQ